MPRGLFPGLPRSPLLLIQEQLSSPRYQAPQEAFRKAVAFLTGPERDLANGAKEAVSAVESLAKIITEQPKATLGDAVKTLRVQGKVCPPLDQLFTSVYGASSQMGGVRHGGIDLPDITDAEATLVLRPLQR